MTERHPVDEDVGRIRFEFSFRKHLCFRFSKFITSLPSYYGRCIYLGIHIISTIIKTVTPPSPRPPSASKATQVKTLRTKKELRVSAHVELGQFQTFLRRRSGAENLSVCNYISEVITNYKPRKSITFGNHSRLLTCRPSRASYLSQPPVDTARGRPSATAEQCCVPSRLSMAAFLDDLLEAPSQNIIRHFSSSPARPNWVNYVNFNDAIAALEPSSVLASAARESFVSVSSSKEILEDGSILLPGADISFLALWILVAGQSLEGLRLDNNKFSTPDPSEVDSLTPLVDLACSSVRNLDVSPMPWDRSIVSPNPCALAQLAGSRGRLREISADGHHWKYIEKHCIGLEKLVLRTRPEKLQGMLSTVGPTLTCLQSTES